MPQPGRSAAGRRRFLAGSGALAASFALPRSARGAARQPNIVFIMADDMGYADLGCFGSRHIRTPNLDRLAAEGVRCTSAYANAPVCSPTRLALITGQYQYRFRTGLVEPFRAGPWGDAAIPERQPTLPGELRKAGYRTALVGKWHLGETTAGGPLAHGYDHFFGFLPGGIDYFTHEAYQGGTLREGDRTAVREGYLTDVLADEAIATVRRFAKGAQPFLLSLHFNAPHWPWEGPEDRGLGTRGAHFDGGSLQTYARMTESLDANIGRLLGELDTLGIAGNTLVVFTSDNGGERFSDEWPFRGMKGSLLEGGIRVPTIVRWPGRLRAGQDNAAMLASMDWMPTFLDAAGVAEADLPPMDGISLLPALSGEANGERELFWRFQGHNQRAMRRGRWKYFQLGEIPFLFDLSADTMERANRAQAEAGVLATMTASWERWNGAMVRDDTIEGFCPSPEQTAEPLDVGPGTSCKPSKAE